jgi:ribonuclease BN (tRNA processing enzyme)
VPGSDTGHESRVCENPAVKLTVVGCSPAWPNPGGAHAGFLVEGPGRLLVDCGPGVLSRLRRRENWPEIDAIAISHLHLDHFGDLVAWVWGATQGPGKASRRPRLLLPPGGEELLRNLAAVLGSDEGMFERCFQLREYAPRVPLTAAGFELLAIPVSHYATDAYGLRISDGTSTLAYSGDSGPEAPLGELARDCDLFVCEATLAEPEAGGVRGHMSLAEAQAAFRSSGARRLLVTHRPSELASEDGVEAAREGLEIEL